MLAKVDENELAAAAAQREYLRVMLSQAIEVAQSIAEFEIAIDLRRIRLAIDLIDTR